MQASAPYLRLKNMIGLIKVIRQDDNSRFAKVSVYQWQLQANNNYIVVIFLLFNTMNNTNID